jgi:hypothetical protein
MGLQPVAHAGLPESPMLLLLVTPFIVLSFWGLAAGSRALHGRNTIPIGWMSTEWLAEQRASHAS